MDTIHHAYNINYRKTITLRRQYIDGMSVLLINILHNYLLPSYIDDNRFTISDTYNCQIQYIGIFRIIKIHAYPTR